MLPTILFVWDYYLGRKFNQKLFTEEVPFLIVSLLPGILIRVVRIDTVSPYDFNLFDRFIIICSSFTAYFLRLFFPAGLSTAYAYLLYLGLFFILADITEQIMNFSGRWKTKLKYLWIPVMAIFTAGASSITYNRNFLWKDTISLYCLMMS